MIRSGDIVIIGMALVLVIGLARQIYVGTTATRVRITVASHEHSDYPAWHERQIAVSGPLGETVVEIAEGRARVVSSPCTQKICLRSGWLEAAGDATACVPNRVSVALLGRDPRFDAVSF